jgi:2-polyprenyl-6-methoxyphenol hydroxylase-like FAD-dependent oxidoreductase
MLPGHALVIGGSLGGLMSACLLLRAGWRVEIFERVEQPLSGRGAGIVTHPQLLDALARCGARIDASIGVKVNTRLVLDASGREICRLTLPQVLTSWGRLFALLKAAFPDAGYHRGYCLTRIHTGAERIRAEFDNGQQVEADLLVAADGLRSTIRAQLMPAVMPQYAGYVAWRGLIEEQALSPATHAQLFENFAFCLPPGEQMLGYPVAGPGNSTQRGERRYNIVWYRPAAQDSELADLLTDASGQRHEIAIPPPLIRSEVVARMREAAATLLAPQFAELVQLTQQPFCQPIYDVESRQLAFGRVALLGDAAFVARPHVGMGVTKAGDDALALVSALQECEDVPAALRRYDAERVRAGTAIIARARHLGAYMQAQIKTPEERAMAEHYRTPEAVIRETATPESMWSSIPA